MHSRNDDFNKILHDIFVNILIIQGCCGVASFIGLRMRVI